MAVRLTRDERKAQTREQILAAARKVFLRNGFHGSSLDEIAEEAGYTKGAVYSNFRSKDDLFLALLDERFERRTAASLGAARQAKSFDAGVRANARMMAEAARDEPTWDSMLVEFWTHASRNPELRAAAAVRHDRVLVSVGGMLDELAERFGFQWTLPATEIVRAAGAFTRGMALERLLDPDAVSPERFEEEFLTFVKRYIQSSDGKGA